MRVSCPRELVKAAARVLGTVRMPGSPVQNKRPLATTTGKVPGKSSSDSAVPKESRAQIRMRILSRSPVFQAIPPAEKERIAALSVYRLLPNGEALTRHGDEVTFLIVVGRGSLKVSLPTADPGTDFLAGTFVEGDVIGEIGIFENLPRVGSHIAIANTEVLLVPKAEVLALVSRRPEAAVRLIRAVCTKLRLAIDLGLALHSHDFPSRFYLRLLYLSRSGSRHESGGFRIQHGLSQKELADSIATSRESLNRLLAEWKQAGFIDYGRGFVVIRDAAALAGAMSPEVRANGILGAPAA